MLRFIRSKASNLFLRYALRNRSLEQEGRNNLTALNHLQPFKPASSYSYVVVDIETTGLNLEKDRAISIGAFRIKNGRIILGDVFNRLIRPEIDIPVESIKIHGIVPDMLQKASTAGEVIKDFLSYIGTDILVAHHAAFDLNFLNRMMRHRYGFPLQNLVLDTLSLCNRTLPSQPYVVQNLTNKLSRRQLLPESGIQSHHSLGNLAALFGIKLWQRHTAVGDAITTAMIFQRILSKMEKAGKKKLFHLVN